jgi:endogenous inhibitor of DNA gyrase (YacG/DUF329 family)
MADEIIIKCKNCDEEMHIAPTVKYPCPFCSQACQLEYEAVN